MSRLPSPSLRQGDLDLTDYKAFIKGGKKGSAFVAGEPESSLVVAMIEGRHQPLMPLGGPALEEKVINQFRSWILSGAEMIPLVKIRGCLILHFLLINFLQ